MTNPYALLPAGIRGRRCRNRCHNKSNDIHNRTYSIDQVDYQKDAVTLRDITGTTDSRFPPTRQETTGMVRSYLEEEPEYPLSEETERQNAAPHPDLTEQAADCLLPEPFVRHCDRVSSYVFHQHHPPDSGDLGKVCWPVQN